MTRMHFANGTVLLRDHEAASLCIAIEDGRIAALSNGARDDAALDLEGGWLVPGFIDTQVNGGGGVLFNDDISVDAIRRIGAAHAAHGTTGFLPTLISVAPERIERALDAVDRAIAEAVPGVLGIHVEGPFLNPARKGIHDERKFERLGDDTIALLTRPRAGRVMVTIAPELAGEGAIARLVAGGVIVSAGHTEADYAAAMHAFDQGVTGVTHLYNAMSPLVHRAPGMVGAALDHDAVWCGLIVDGHHVHPAALRIAIRLLGDRAMLVTDAMSGIGLPDQDFIFNGRTIHVVDGICRDEDGTLAGSLLDMTSAVRNTVELGFPLAQVAEMAAANPAAFLRMSADRGVIAAGQRADFVWLGRDLSHRATWIGGERIA